MILPRLAPLVLLALLVPPAPLAATDDDPSTAGGKRYLPSLHLGSFTSMLAGRLDDDGTLDSGAGVLRLRDGDGQPLELLSLAYGRQTNLWARFSVALDGVDVNGRALGASRTRDGDTRLVCMLQLTLSNTSREQRLVELQGLLSPGGDGDPRARPRHTLPFAPGATFAHEGKLVSRDGAALLQWAGPEPEVTLADAVGGPDDTAATLDWSFTMDPRSTRYIELMLVGPPTGSAVAEEGFRALLANQAFDLVAESLDWQSMYRGRFSNFEGGHEHMRQVMMLSVHTLRMLGVCSTEVGTITEWPYGHPSRDEGMKAEALGMFAEWGLGAFAEPDIRDMTRRATEVAAGLAPDRRLVIVHGLVRAARLSADDEMPQILATAIRELVTEPTTVQPWLDPDEVTVDLEQILERASMYGGGDDTYTVPKLSWAPEPTAPVETLMAAMRRELSAGRVAEAWELYKQIMDTTDVRGIGSMAGDGSIDGRFALGFMALTRALLIDDRGSDVRFFPNITEELVPPLGQLHLPLIPTRFGLIDASLFWVGRSQTKLAAQIFDRGMIIPGRVLLELPQGLTARALQGVFNGEAALLQDGAIECRPGKLARGVRFNIPVRRN
ncbi:MAG: hypothetical protein ACYTCU_01695 [Planctomycetota bacterium]|jgi:hypothetical protein